MRPKFRETLWFKKGEKDAQVAAEADPRDVMAPKAVDSLPIEDRYNDDQEGLSPLDSIAFGIHTGRTEYLPKTGAHVPLDPEEDAVDQHQLVRDLKRGRMKIFAAIGAGALLVVTVITLFVV
ncbi:MAG TPA: hypothetical protein VGC41_18035 [Kofleriaceae bacterium]